MLRFTRYFSVALLSGLAAFGHAQTPAAEGSVSVLPPELQAELDALQASLWHPSATVRASVGFRDNVLLSPFAPIERGFARGEVEAMLLRPMRRRWEFVSFLTADVLRYLSPPAESKGEQQWFLHTEARWEPAERARLSLKAAGYIRDMVIDLSETEAQRVVAPTRVNGGYAMATTRFLLPAGFRVEPSFQFRRSDYEAYAGDYDDARGGARVEWRRSSALALSAGWFETRRDYDQRVQFTAGGRALAGTRLKFVQREGDVKARGSWAGAAEWDAALTAGRLENRDGGSGYFDYTQSRVRLELGWERSDWRVWLDAEARRIDYRVQTVGAGISPPPRIADDFETTVRVERRLTPTWTLFAEHRWERSRSNEIEFSYRANTVLAGVQREF